jgi:hypothetical protein
MPREPAWLTSGGMDAGAPGSLERAQAWKAEANVRRRGVGNPEPTCEVALFGCE